MVSNSRFSKARPVPEEDDISSADESDDADLTDGDSINSDWFDMAGKNMKSTEKARHRLTITRVACIALRCRFAIVLCAPYTTLFQRREPPTGVPCHIIQPSQGMGSLSSECLPVKLISQT